MKVLSFCGNYVANLGARIDFNVVIKDGIRYFWWSESLIKMQRYDDSAVGG